MDKKFRLPKQILSIVLCVVLVLSCLPRTSLIANAADDEIRVEVLGGNGEKVADQPTLNDWKQFFGKDVTTTKSVGTVWTDKSVFTSVKDYTDATDEQETSNFGLVMDDEDNNFLVSLSAIASSKSVEGYSTLPTDTILVLDLSGSMVNNDAVAPLVQSANDAITRLQELNSYNRVGVVAYSGNTQTDFSETSTAEVILPLGRYTPGLDGNNRSAYLVSSWTTGSGWNQDRHTGVKVANGVTGTVAKGITDTINTNNQKDAAGGTYIQNGLYKAYQQFNAVKDTTIEEGMQSGTSRVPVVVLLSDGAPTTATTDYTNIGKSDSGNGTNTYATPGIAFLTQLTASWVREKVEAKYGTNSLFYTLGLKVQDNDAAESVLDPSNNTATDSYWDTYLDLKNKNNKNMSVTISGNTTRQISYTDSVTWTEDSENYVTEYFPASNATGLISAFSSIVEQIIVQSLYYPTYVETGGSIDHSGFLDFEDYIGKNMEVKSVKGIQLGTKLYTGQTLAKMIYEGGMGTIENPTDVGNNFVWAVQQRLGIDNVADARTVIGQAYSNGQLYYNPETGEYSNYIGWYAGANGEFVDFWDGEDASADVVPDSIKDEAVYAIKSYGYYDAVGEGHRETDMMYATIQVRTTLKTTAEGKTDASEEGDVRIIGRLPASLIPLVEYNIDLNGIDPMNPASMTIEGADTPSRLLYEVGLDSDVDVLNLAGTAADSFDKNTGKYVFYTNEWFSIEEYSYSYATNKNTTSYFSPSIENERYYYNVDTPIYINESGTLYDGEQTPVYDENDLFYHRTIIYERQDNGAVTAEWFYEPISKDVLDKTSDLEKRTDANGNTYWVVVKGTIYHYYSEYIVEKGGGNHTQTIDVSDMPFVHDVTEGIRPDEFHVDSYLGNNGRLTIDPFEGIKISKIVDDTITDKSGEYTFTVTADVDNFNEECIAIYEDAEGNRTERTVKFTGGTATVKLSHGEAIYILSDAMVGRTFTIEEDEGEGYQVGSVSVSENGTVVNGDVAELPVANNSIATADFVNTRIVNGDVLIGKRVVSTFESHEQKEFTFTVTLSGDMLSQGDTFNTVKPDGTAGNDIVYRNGVTNTVTLKHGEHITIKGLPEGATVNVTEEEVQGDGFTADKLFDDADVVAGETQYIIFTNTYEAEDSEPFSTVVEVIKNLDAPENASWNGTFRFQLERYNGTEYVKVGNVASMAYPSAKTVNLNITDEVFETAGTYSYRVVEIVDANNENAGIVYDTTPCYFNIVVSDDGSGKLFVSNVVAVTDSTVSGNAQTEWKVDATFNNTYVVNGAAGAIINITKTIDDGGKGVTILPSGFMFELYEADEQWVYDTKAEAAYTSYATGADGKTEISLTFDNLDEYHYVLKEVVGNNDNIVYSIQEYRIIITVADVDGKYSVNIKVYDGDSLKSQVSKVATENDSVAIAETEGLAFENTYTPDPVTLRPSISGTKTLTGRTQKDGDFTFELYETGSDFEINASATPKYTASASAAGAFRFGELEYDQVGKHYYVVKEQIPADATNNKKSGVTYDTSEYHITVTVTADNNAGTLSAAAIITKSGNTVSNITFNNTYVPDSTTAVIGGGKILRGGIRKLQARAFEFELLEGNDVIRTAYNGVSEDGVNADFVFDAITYDKAGEYEYTIREKMPEDVDGQNKKNGVTYDGTVYTVIVTVTDNGDGTLTPDVKYSVATGNSVDKAVFTNAYTVEETSIELSGTKNLKGDDLSKYSGAKAFYYELYRAKWDSNTRSIIQDGDEPIARVTNNSTGGYSFKDIVALKFDAIGGYYFIIKEAVPTNADPLMVYDTSEYYVEVDVIDNLTGNLEATTRITKVDAEGNETTVADNGIDFNNVLEEEPITADIEGEKNYNIGLQAGQFTFELYQALKDKDGKINAVGEPVLTTQNAADGSFKFEEYTGASENPITSFITFSEAGTYYFVVKEQLPEGVTEGNKTLEGITYDTNAYVITVAVSEGTDETGRAILLADVLVDGEANGDITFENKYNASAEKGVVISGEKTLNGKTLTDNEFTFELYEAILSGDGTVSYEEEPLDTATNKGKVITFKEIKYTSLEDARTHYYVVKEQIPEGADKDNKFGCITYDDTEYLVTVEVVDQGNGTLAVSDPIYQVIGDDNKVTQAEVDSVNFTNTHTPAAITYDITGKKTLKKDGAGVSLDGKQFEFALYETGSDYVVAEDAKPVATVKNGVDGTFTFANLPAETTGTAYYVVKELASPYEDINSDATVYNICVTISDNDGTLVASSVITVDGKAVDNVTFVNNFKPKPEEPSSPTTGDNNRNGIWSVLLAVSFFAICVCFVYDRKTRKREE